MHQIASSKFHDNDTREQENSSLMNVIVVVEKVYTYLSMSSFPFGFWLGSITFFILVDKGSSTIAAKFQLKDLSRINCTARKFYSSSLTAISHCHCSRIYILSHVLSMTTTPRRTLAVL